MGHQTTVLSEGWLWQSHSAQGCPSSLPSGQRERLLPHPVPLGLSAQCVGHRYSITLWGQMLLCALRAEPPVMEVALGRLGAILNWDTGHMGPSQTRTRLCPGEVGEHIRESGCADMRKAGWWE